MGKKSSTVAASKISAASAPTTSSAALSSNRSSILRSAFAPSYLQLHLFASIIQSFESQELRIHDTTTGRLRHQHTCAVGTDVTCLDWGYYGASYRESRQLNKKKRKRRQDAAEHVVVAYGTNDSQVHMFSPSEGRVLRSLPTVHEQGIRQFKFCSTDNLQAWSVGGDGQLIQWDLDKDQPVRCVSLWQINLDSH